MRHFIDLFEDARLRGTLDPKTLAQSLPDVNDIPLFTRAVAKVKNGRTDTLTRQEMTQLAYAFISVLQDDRETTLDLMRRLARVEEM